MNTPKLKRKTVKLGQSLFIRIYPSGLKSYVLRYYRQGQVRDLTLGHNLTVKQAKQLAHLKRKELELKPSIGLKLNDAYQLWKRKKRKNSSFKDECARIDNHIMPTLGKLNLEEITAPVALNALLPLSDKLPTLKRCLMHLNEMLDLAVFSGLIASNPCRKLSKIFEHHTPVARAYIPAAELHLLFEKFSEAPLWLVVYLLFAIYSMLRPVEVSSLKWSWIEGDTLTIPADVMKKRRIHRVPICSEVLAMLSLIKTRSTYVFAFGRNGKPINKQYLTKLLSKLDLKHKPCHHGFRATARTWLHDNNVAYEVAEDCLAHLTASPTERAYLRADFLEQRRPIMSKWWQFIWSEYCASCAKTEPYNAIKTALDKI